MENRTAKKEIILEAALTLFSQKGYDGVSIDELADEIGMRGPALYHYFKGKEAILDELLVWMEELYAKSFGEHTDLENMPCSLETLEELTMQRVKAAVHDPQLRKIRRLLSLEQFRSKEFGRLNTQVHLSAGEKLHEPFFAELIKEGVLREYDPGILAFEFTTPITMLMKRIDREPEAEEEIMNMIREHIRYFIYANSSVRRSQP